MGKKVVELLRNIERKYQHCTGLGLTRFLAANRDQDRRQRICHGSCTDAAKEADMLPFREILSGCDKLSHL